MSTRISGANPVFEDAEVVFGLVGPVGTNFDRFCNLLQSLLAEFGYQSREVRLSRLTENYEVDPVQVSGSTYFGELNQKMHAGNALRKTARRGEFLALAAAQYIGAERPKPPVPPVQLKTAQILRSLKHPDEVRALRRIYGSGFYLIGVTVDEEERGAYLLDKGCSSEEIEKLLVRDEHEEDLQYFDDEGNNYGQRTRDTFQLADVVVPRSDERQLERFLSLVFGCPFHTPTPDEHAMFLAFGASLRSGDLSRQVGAVVVSSAGDVIGLGANDVPRHGGGLFWPGDDDERDHVKGKDSNEERRDEIVLDVIGRLRPDATSDQQLREARSSLRDSPLMDITEYGRAVHAEMEALLSCARSGTSTRGATLFCTTFPCHNCAKHIIAAGVRRVVYVEPYPKSQAKTLFKDSILFGKGNASDERVRFEPFVGIGPRRFFDLFSMGLSSGTAMRRKRLGKKVEWTHVKGILRIAMLPNSYLEREVLAGQELLALAEKPEGSA